MKEQLPSYVRTFTCTKVSTGATTYHLKPTTHEALAGWALATVNDATGELAIQSDWGNWSYRWSTDPRSLGRPTLTHFIADRGGCHYLADKLTSREEREHFDVRKTVAHLQGMLARKRLEWGRDLLGWHDGEPDAPDVMGDDPPRRHHTFKVWDRYSHRHEDWPLTRTTARRIWDELEELTGEDDVRAFVEAFYRIEGHDIISEQPWDGDLQYTPAPMYMQLLHGILPALVEACRSRLRNAAEAGSAEFRSGEAQP